MRICSLSTSWGLSRSDGTVADATQKRTDTYSSSAPAFEGIHYPIRGLECYHKPSCLVLWKNQRLGWNHRSGRNSFQSASRQIQNLPDLGCRLVARLRPIGGVGRRT